MKLLNIHLLLILFVTLITSMFFHVLEEGMKTDNKKSKKNKKIPKGDEDLYILKTKMVTPVCPVCPSVSETVFNASKCPPCPPCARCPEPSFDCKKVPSYSASNDKLPRPILSDFSQFGA